MNEKRIYIGGTFDTLHPGHVNLFKRAKELGTVIVSLNTDEFTTRFKRKPVMNLAERMAMVEAVRYVDEVIVNDGCEDSRPAILKSRATHILHGDDWTGDSLMKQLGLDQAWLDEHGIEMMYLPYTKGISSTAILERIFHHEDLWTHA